MAGRATNTPRRPIPANATVPIKARKNNSKQVTPAQDAKIRGTVVISNEEQLVTLQNERFLAQEALAQAEANGGGFNERNKLNIINAKISKLEKTTKLTIEPVTKLKVEPPTSKGEPDSIDKRIDKTGVSTTDTQIDAVPLNNELHQYPSYTYGLSLHLLTKDEYNQIVLTGEFKAKRVLIASAGRYNNTLGPSQFVRSKYFDRDYFFESLDMTTVIGANESNRNTNAISLSFNIIEPYGMTLMDNIIKICKDESVNSQNWIDMPYLLQIDFYASNDAGEIVGKVPGITKNIPIRLVKMDISAGTEGSRYAIQAVPFGQSAFDQSRVTTPIGLEVTASSVGGFFSATKETSNVTNSERPPVNSYTTANGQVVPSLLLSAESISDYEKDHKKRVKSYGSAINAHYKDLVDRNKIKYRDRYIFKFPDEIGKSKFTLYNKVTPKDTRMGDVDDSLSIRRANTGASSDDLDFNLRIFSVNAGTSIDAVLDYIIRNSDYIQSQITVPEEYADDASYQTAKKLNEKKPLKWFKIVPSVKLTDYDTITKVWARDITYHVVPYTIYNTKIDVAPQGTAQYPLKVYNYLYSGKNTDVIDFSIQFNALFYTAVTAHRENMNQPSANSANTPDDKNPDNYNGQEIGPNAIQPGGTKPQTQHRSTATGGHNNARAIASADVAQSIYSTAAGDMIQLSLKIIGDHQFIKQDDIFYSPHLTNGTTSDLPAIGTDLRLTANGSILTDRGEIYVEVNFTTPSDIDENIGLMDFENGQQSSFSGMYRVIKVESNFRDGAFTQTVEVVRLPRQAIKNSGDPEDATVNSTRSNDIAIAPDKNKPVTVGSNVTKVTSNDSDDKKQNIAPPTSADTTLTKEQQSLREIGPNFKVERIGKNSEPVSVVNDARINKLIEADANIEIITETIVQGNS